MRRPYRRRRTEDEDKDECESDRIERLERQQKTLIKIKKRSIDQSTK